MARSKKIVPAPATEAVKVAVGDTVHIAPLTPETEAQMYALAAETEAKIAAIEASYAAKLGEARAAEADAALDAALAGIPDVPAFGLSGYAMQQAMMPRFADVRGLFVDYAPRDGEPQVAIVSKVLDAETGRAYLAVIGDAPGEHGMRIVEAAHDSTGAPGTWRFQYESFEPDVALPPWPPLAPGDVLVIPQYAPLSPSTPVDGAAIASEEV